MNRKQNDGDARKGATLRKLFFGRVGIFLIIFVLVGGYWAYRLTSASHSRLNIYANGVENSLTINVNSSLFISWDSQLPGCDASGSWSGIKSASGNENRSGDTATAGTRVYALSCSSPVDGDSDYNTVTVNVVNPSSPPPPPPPPNPPSPPPTPPSPPVTPPSPPPPGSPTPPPPSPGSPAPSPSPSPGSPSSGAILTPRPAPSPPSFSITPSVQPSNGLNFDNVRIDDQTYTTALITWMTNRAATGRLVYGEDSGFVGAKTITLKQAKTTQSATLKGLRPGIKYYFQIIAKAGSRQTPIQGQLDTQGLPVRVIITDEQQKPVEGLAIAVGEQTSQTDSAGQVFFSLPIGPADVAVSHGKTKRQFSLNVENKVPKDPKAIAEEQIFTFTIPVQKKLNIAKLLLVVIVLAVLGAVIWLIRRRRSNWPPPKGSSHSAVTSRRGHRKKHVETADMPMPPPPVAVQPTEAAAPAYDPHTGHHIPDWQAQIQADLKKSMKDKADELPKDMFETADELYHYDQKLKKPPHHKQ